MQNRTGIHNLKPLSPCFPGRNSWFLSSLSSNSLCFGRIKSFATRKIPHKTVVSFLPNSDSFSLHGLNKNGHCYCHHYQHHVSHKQIMNAVTVIFIVQHELWPLSAIKVILIPIKVTVTDILWFLWLGWALLILAWRPGPLFSSSAHCSCVYSFVYYWIFIELQLCVRHSDEYWRYSGERLCSNRACSLEGKIGNNQVNLQVFDHNLNKRSEGRTGILW